MSQSTKKGQFSLSKTANLKSIHDFSVERTEYHLRNLDDGRTHFPYELEAQLNQHIKNGNYENALELIRTLVENKDYDSGTMAFSPLKQAEYGAVLAVSFFCRDAIEGGLDPMEAYDYNDLYLQKISEFSTIDGYIQICEDALFDFCYLVKKSQEKQVKSLHIKRCKQYIYEHLTQPFSLEEMAESLQLNKTYLSGYFNKYEHITLKSYTLKKRIEAAENMLKYSNYPSSEIADRFCFSSQSHFSQVFKKYTGMTPSSYRIKFKPATFV